MTNYLEKALQDDAFAAAYSEVSFIQDVLAALDEISIARGMTRAELARHLGVPRSQITSTFAGRNVSLRTVARFSRALGVAPVMTFSTKPVRWHHGWSAASSLTCQIPASLRVMVAA